jgi:hypothetical protein
VEHPKGTNYDITGFSDILPIVVTPFVEYIPSLKSYYWLSKELPRVMTPAELKKALENETFSAITRNLFPVG